MTTSKRLAAHRATASSASEEPEITDLPDDDEDQQAGKQKDKTKMSDTNKDQEAAVAQAAADAKKEANERFSAVLASEHYTGRETLRPVTKTAAWIRTVAAVRTSFPPPTAGAACTTGRSASAELSPS